MNRGVVVIQALSSADKGGMLRAAASGHGPLIYVSLDELRDLPRSPFAYWLNDEVRALFRSHDKFEGSGSAGQRHAKQGLATSDDWRFVRLWFETPKGDLTYLPIAKGRGMGSFYADISEVLRWGDKGAEARSLMAFVELAPGTTHWSRRIVGVSYYERAGITWPVRAARFSPRALPPGCVFATRGLSAFTDAGDDLLALMGLLSSSIFDFLFKANLGRYGFPEFLAGVLPAVPMPDGAPVSDGLLATLVATAWRLKRRLDEVNESSHAFLAPAAVQAAGQTFESRHAAWSVSMKEAAREISCVQRDIDERCFELYGLSEEARHSVSAGLAVKEGEEASPSEDADEDDDPLSPSTADAFAAALVSWAVGVAAGRFDVRLATGDREWPVEPDPFDPLPVCSPGMLTGDEGLPLTVAPAGYPIEPSPILVDDPGHQLDLTARVRSVFDVVFGDLADDWWSDVGKTLDPKNGIEGWLRRGFCDHHLKTYSKSRRKAPIMWPIGTTSGSYRVWLYAHRVTTDTLFQVLTDILEPKLATEQRRLSDLTQEFGPTPSASQHRILDTQQTFVDELIAFRDELRAVAPLWQPDLNDGIVIVLAPLWRLFAHHRPWSKELKDRWTKLAKGDYDWAQLAMHIWPERVIPKCATDRSLAIAHNLEDTFWTQDPTNPDKWHPRHTPTTPIDQLTTQHTNPTITTTRTHPNP